MTLATSSYSKVFNLVAGGIQLIKLGFDVESTISDPKMSTNEKVQRIAIDSLVAGTRSLSMIANFQEWPVEDRIQLKGAVMAAEVLQHANLMYSRQSLKVGDHIVFGNSLVLSVKGVLDDMIELKPELLGKNLDTAIDVSSGLNFIWGSVTIGVLVAEPVIRYLCQKPNPVDVTIRLDRLGDKEPELRIDLNLNALVREMKAVDSIGEFSEIPSVFRDDVVFGQFRCPLSGGKPIRHVLYVRGGKEDDRRVYYERSAMVEHLKKHPNKKPPGWPKNVPFSRYALHKDLYAQKVIDARLDKLRDDFSALPEIPEPEFDEKQLQKLAHSLGIGDDQKSDKQVFYDMIGGMPRSVRSNISGGSIRTTQHLFVENGKPQKARFVTFDTIAFDGAVHLSNFERQHALLGLMGSNMGRDRRLAEKVIRAFKKIEICISMDLKFGYLKWN